MNENPLRCPEIGCTGWISEVDDGDEHFWGCGECGNAWYERGELDEAIGNIISQFAYRKKVYRKSKGSWQPMPLEKEPENYEELVEAEEGEEESGGEYDDVFLACPVSRCGGSCFYSEDEDGWYWMCDTCDSRWFDTKNFMKEIAAMIKQYPYRKQLYRKSDRGYEPVEWEGDIMEYEALVRKEPGDKKRGKKRG